MTEYGALIFAYHTISESQVENAVSAHTFFSQMQMLKDENYTVVSLNELELMRNERIPEGVVCITFDDGFKDTYTSAFPVLSEFNFPASVFVETASIGGISKNHGEWFDMLSEKELRLLSNSGLVSIQPHTHNHPRLTAVSSKAAKSEIQKSKDIIEDLTGNTCNHFAYPYGLQNSATQNILHDIGINNGYTTQHDLVYKKSNSLALGRLNIRSNMCLRSFLAYCKHTREAYDVDKKS